MKRRITVVIFIALTSAMSWGQSIKEQLAALKTEAAPYLAKSEENKKALTALNQTYTDINDGVAALTKSVNNYKTDLAAYMVDFAAYNAAVNEHNTATDAHNAHRCSAPQGSNACDWYNQEANRSDVQFNYLNTQKADLNRRQGYLDQTHAKNDELTQILSDKSEKYTSDEKAYNAQNNENEAKLEPLRARWKALMGQLKSCLDKLPPNPTDEMLHDGCGQLWDGNSIHTDPVNQGTGTKAFGHD